MNDHTDQNREFCYYHPQQALVGVCPFCLHEKLLVIEATQGRRRRLRRRRSRRGDGGHNKAPTGNIVGLPKMLALGSFLNRRRRKSRRRSSYGCEDGGGGSDHSQSTSDSLEDSFISINFEENGVALWDNVSKVGKKASCQDHLGLTKESLGRSGSNRSVVEHPKATREPLRWRKRIGHFLQLVKLKRSNKGSGGLVKVRGKGWIGALTKGRRTNQE